MAISSPSPRPRLPRRRLVWGVVLGVAVLVAAAAAAVLEWSGASLDGDPMALAHLKAQPFARSEEHTSELQSPALISYAVFCLKKKKKTKNGHTTKI